MTGKCAICGVEADLTKHHLIPQTMCRNKYRKAKNDESNFVWLCPTCHIQVHARFSARQLRDTYFTIDAMLKDDRFARFVAWKKKHLKFEGSSKRSKDHA